MLCCIIRPYLSAYVDGELRYARSQQVQEHLNGCTACRAYYRDLVEIKSSVRTLSKRLPSEALSTKLAAISEKPVEARWGFPMASIRQPGVSVSRLIALGASLTAVAVVVRTQVHALDARPTPLPPDPLQAAVPLVNRKPSVPLSMQWPALGPRDPGPSTWSAGRFMDAGFTGSRGQAQVHQPHDLPDIYDFTEPGR